ncbi:hypothetical protein [Carnobacterium maltaromaticum]|uniref:hypothetical protein n=1 Tax=Carnobacterium maltaromaticum TaxID=2751 RepID=UPI0012FB5302|nr:hypothetical protein [Carnobacterium maltaromaticum]
MHGIQNGGLFGLICFIGPIIFLMVAMHSPEMVKKMSIKLGIRKEITEGLTEDKGVKTTYRPVKVGVYVSTQIKRR